MLRFCPRKPGCCPIHGCKGRCSCLPPPCPPKVQPDLISATNSQAQILAQGGFLRFNRVVARQGDAIRHGPDQTIFTILQPGRYRFLFCAQATAATVAANGSAGVVMTVNSAPIETTRNAVHWIQRGECVQLAFDIRLTITRCPATVRLQNLFDGTCYSDVRFAIIKID